MSGKSLFEPGWKSVVLAGGACALWAWKLSEWVPVNAWTHEEHFEPGRFRADVGAVGVALYFFDDQHVELELGPSSTTKGDWEILLHFGTVDEVAAMLPGLLAVAETYLAVTSV